MSKKLHGNGLWESSRMMLPQHKERIIEHQQQYNRQSRPIIHEDELEIMTRNISDSLHYKEVIKVRLFSEYEPHVICGVVTEISPFTKKIRMEIEEGLEWIDFDEIVSVQFM
ncbi:hypothetical protein J2T13_003038 [Paenibacillus sp. DS2015]|uniref:YolD-like family protein n=1 Tax=Paenibacillus sp. DS2015 TaxID=3373917 RepID=UPI003D25D606